MSPHTARRVALMSGIVAAVAALAFTLAVLLH